MKKIAIYFSDPGALDYPLNKKVFFESYAYLIEQLAQKGVELIIVRADSYLQNGEFNNYFQWNGTTYIPQDKKIKVDLIWNRDDKNTIPIITDCPIFNSVEFDELCRDKLKTFQKLPKFAIETFLVNEYEEAQDVIKNKIPTQKVVLKPRFGEQAQGVYILEKNEITKELYQNWNNIIVQSFVDTSVGINNLVEGTHEINISIIDGAFAGARVKTPPQGSLITNVTGAAGLGGSVFEVPFDKVPQELWTKTQELDQELSNFEPRFYRADFSNSPEGYKLIEINSRPGLAHSEKEGPIYTQDMLGGLVDFLSEI